MPIYAWLEGVMTDNAAGSVQAWWDAHPMNYQGYSHIALATDDDFRAFFRKADEAWWRTDNQINSAKPEYPGDKLVDKARIQGKRVLEIGCGIGFWTEAFAKWGCQTSAIDLTAYGVEMTKKRLSLAGLSADVRK